MFGRSVHTVQAVRVRGPRRPELALHRGHDRVVARGGFLPARYPHPVLDLYLVMGVAGALGLFLSIVFHELSHSLVARRFGIEINGITLFIFGGVAEMKDEPAEPRGRVPHGRGRPPVEPGPGRGGAGPAPAPGGLGWSPRSSERASVPRLDQRGPGRLQPCPRLSPGRRAGATGHSLGAFREHPVGDPGYILHRFRLRHPAHRPGRGFVPSREHGGGDLVVPDRTLPARGGGPGPTSSSSCAGPWRGSRSGGS